MGDLIPLASNRLCLLFEFDLSSVEAWRDLPSRNHQLACEEACESSSLRPKETCAARAITTDKDASLLAAQQLPFDCWHYAHGKHIWFEFLYSTSKPQLCIRAVTTLPKSDGVTASRLALHTLEAVERSGPVCSPSLERFKANPPFTWGLRQMWNMVTTILATTIDVYWPTWLMPKVDEREREAPTTHAGMRAYYLQPSPAPAQFRTYLPPDGMRAYKKMIHAMGTWKEKAGWKGFFNLLNFSPVAAPSIVYNASDLLDIHKRYDGMFIPPGPPTGGPMWRTMNVLHVKLLFVNNYGRHSHTFRARPTQFLWDWMQMSAPVAGAGCIAINGVFMAWTRWTPRGQKEGKDIQEEALGKPVGIYDQITHFKEEF